MDALQLNIKEEVASYIAKNILFRENGFPYSEDASFLENGIIDSMSILELVMFVEEKYHIHVVDGEIVPDNFDTINSMASFIQGKLNHNQ